MVIIRKAIWIIINLLIMFFSIRNRAFGLTAIPVFTFAFLQEDFIIALKEYKHKIITLKALFKQYRISQTLNFHMLIVYFEMLFGMDFISIGTMKLSQLHTNGTAIFFTTFGIVIIIGFVREIITFN